MKFSCFAITVCSLLLVITSGADDLRPFERIDVYDL